MSSPRLFRELAIMLATFGGAVVGYAAGTGMEPAAHMSCAFVGMALFGAFADFCIRGGK